MDQPEPKKRRLEGMSVEDRLRRSRERNREHARRTRQRKKAQLQTLQSRFAELQEAFAAGWKAAAGRSMPVHARAGLN